MKGKGFFTRRTVSNMIVVVFGVLVYMGLSNFTAIRDKVGWLFGIISPFVMGIGVAYILNMPLRFFENKVFKKLKHKRAVSLLTVYALAALLLVVIVGLLLPNIVDSVIALANNMSGYLNNLNDLTNWITETFHLEADTLDFITVSYSDIITQVANYLTQALPDILNVAYKIGTGIVSFFTAVIASLYMLASKDKLLVQVRRVIYALLPEKRANSVYRISHLSNDLFSGFISGKLLDSLIIGIICYVFMVIANLTFIEMPYAPLISLIIGITNIIPFFGPFIGAIPSIMLLLIINPWSAVWFGVFVIVLQQFDGNILGPKILGDSTGLPPLWILISITVGGGLFGFMGMLLGVPAVAVLYALSSELVERRLRKKGLDDTPGAEQDQTEPAAAGDAPAE